MQLVVLGSAGTYPAAGLPASGYLVTEGETRVLLDAGPGTFGSLAARIDPGSLDAIVLSHIHPDHCSDLYAVFHYLAYGPGGRIPIPVFAPAGAAGALSGLVGDDGPFFSVFDFRTVESETVVVGEVSLRFAPTEHSVPAVAVRVESKDRVLVYSGDTGRGGGVPGLLGFADVFLCDATFQGDRDPEGFQLHLTASEAARLAVGSGVGRLILTHLPPSLDPVVSQREAAEHFPRPVLVATPNMELDI